MTTFLGILGFALAIVMLIVFAYKGYSVIIIAPIAALVALLLSYGLQGHFMANYTITYMAGFANYAKNYFPIYLFGAVFAKLMDTTGAAKSIAKFFAEKLGTSKAILSVVITCAILTYGGVSLFVVAFVVLPIAVELFRSADIPKRLIPGTIALGAFTFTMTALPGSPQVQNTIPMAYFGTDSWAAPVLGVIAAAVMFFGGMFWLNRRAKKAKTAGEGYGNHNEVSILEESNEKLPSIVMAFVPVLIILVVNLVLSKLVYPNVDGAYLEEMFDSTLAANSGTWSVLLGMLVAIIFMIVTNFKQLKKSIKEDLKEAANNSMSPLINSCAVAAFGAVIKTLAVFGVIQAFILGFSGNVLLSEVISVNVLCGMTASASGGLGAALEALAGTLMKSGMSPEVLHRVASVAAGGLDSLPYNGATITVLALCGMTHKDSYKDMFVVSCVIPIIAALVLVVLGTIGIRC